MAMGLVMGMADLGLFVGEIMAVMRCFLDEG
jgi:hypothetical protein